MKFQLLDVTKEKSVIVTEQFPLAETELSQVDAYWRASVGQIYLMDNPRLREPLRAEHSSPLP